MSDFASLLAYVQEMEGQNPPSAEMMKIRPAFLPLTKQQLAERERAAKEADAKAAQAEHAATAAAPKH